jgi:hypothetical protein
MQALYCCGMHQEVDMAAVPDALDYAHRREFRLRDAEKLVGLSMRQILHAGAAKLRLPDWHTGKGNPRLLSIVELFQLRLVSSVDQRVPIPALQHLADLAKGYLGLALTDSDFRRKPAVVLGYPSPTGAWWWLLAVDGKWPDSPPPPAKNAEFLVLVRIREALASLMLAWVEHIKAEIDDAGVALPPAAAFASAVAVDAASSPANDLGHAAAVLARAGELVAA